MRAVLFCLLTLCCFSLAFAQYGTDTLHYRKVYYFGGTGLAFPAGKTKDVLGTQLFSGNMGLDISLGNPAYYIYPALYMMSFRYNQLQDETEYTHRIENGTASFYMLNLGGGARQQFRNLNLYAYAGPTVGVTIEPRSIVKEDMVQMEKKSKITTGVKTGVGADYKFSGFFLGLEIGYLHDFTKIQNVPINVLTLMIGLKSDITGLRDKMARVLGVESIE